MKTPSRYNTWVIPLSYAVEAVVIGLGFPRLEVRLFHGLSSTITIPAAMAIYSSIASGMLALSGVVFSLAFVMIQFSATAYSPRLVLWISRDPFMWHAVGVFTATFLYALAALSWVDRNASGKVPFISSWMVLGLLLASVAMFVGLIQRIGLLQINRMLNFTGDQGRMVIEAVYPRVDSTDAVCAARAVPKLAAYPNLYSSRPSPGDSGFGHRGYGPVEWPAIQPIKKPTELELCSGEVNVA